MKIKGWVNIYKDEHGCYVGSPHKTKKDCVRYAACQAIIKGVKIETEEFELPKRKRRRRLDE